MANTYKVNGQSIKTGTVSIDALDSNLQNTITTGSQITITPTNDGTSDVKKYEFFQGGASIGTINIPKDLVVSEGSVKPCTINNEEKMCIELVLSNNDIIHIPVSDLVDVYTGSDLINISETNTISVNTSKLTDELSSTFLKSDDLHTATDDEIKAFFN